MEPKTSDQLIAWALLRQIRVDLKERKRNRARKRFAREIDCWIKNDASRAKFQPGPEGFEYTFEFWCEQLEVDSEYMARKLRENIL